MKKLVKGFSKATREHICEDSPTVAADPNEKLFKEDLKNSGGERKNPAVYEYKTNSVMGVA